MAIIGAEGSGVIDNYSVRKRHITGLRIRPYTLTIRGPRFANGQTYVGDGDTNGEKLFEAAKVVDTPNCRNC